MARLNRGTVRHERHQLCIMHMSLMAVLVIVGATVDGEIPWFLGPSRLLITMVPCKRAKHVLLL